MRCCVNIGWFIWNKRSIINKCLFSSSFFNYNYLFIMFQRNKLSVPLNIPKGTVHQFPKLFQMNIMLIPIDAPMERIIIYYMQMFQRNISPILLSVQQVTCYLSSNKISPLTPKLLDRMLNSPSTSTTAHIWLDEVSRRW